MKADFPFELTRSDIHIWTLPTTAPDTVPMIFERFLVADEIARAARFRFRFLRESFVIAHGALRYLLGRYLNIHPARIRFIYGSKGKPALAPTSGIKFNMTHCGTLVVIALTMDCEIGVDVEEIRPLPDMQHIANRFFCPAEASEIMSFPQTQRERAFFCCWTRKEAYIKAIGDGLSAPLDDFCVTVQPNRPARFVHIGHDLTAAERWTLHDLPLASKYAAALAYCAPQRSLSLFPIVDLTDLTDTDME